MKIKKAMHKLLRILSALILMIFSLTFFPQTVHASNGIIASIIPASVNSIVIQDFLILDATAYVPKAKISFSILPLAATEINDSAIHATKSAGSESISVKGTPRMGYASFSSDQETYTAVQQSAVGLAGNTQMLDDNVTLMTGEKYAISGVKIDLSKVKFYEPGVYRYAISEAEISDSSITSESDEQKYLDIYVVSNNENDALAVSGYLLKDQTDAGMSKTAGFVNVYTAYDLTVKNTVSGNQSRDDQYFNYVIKLVGCTPNNQYDITTISTYQDLSANATKLTVKSDGTAIGVVWLKAGETFTVYGMPANTVYYTYVDEATLKETGYTSKLIYIGQSPSGKQRQAQAKSISISEDSNPTVSHTLVATTNLIINNDKAGVIPTGIILKTAPYAAVCAVGMVGLILFAVMHRRKEHQETEQ
jgi:hypothetical protein